jgi:hypothetical protein
LDGLLNLGGNAIQIVYVHFPLVEGTDHGVEDLIPVKALTGAIPFDNDNGQTFHDLVGGKSALAFQALTAAADAQAVFGVAGIHNFAVLIAAKRTFHGKSAPFLWFIYQLYQISAPLSRPFFPCYFGARGVKW